MKREPCNFIDFLIPTQFIHDFMGAKKQHPVFMSFFFKKAVAQYNRLQPPRDKMSYLEEFRLKVCAMYGDGQDVFYPFRFDGFQVLIQCLIMNKELLVQVCQHEPLLVGPRSLKSEIYYHQLRLGSILYIYTNNLKKLNLTKDEKCGRTVVARERIASDQCVTIYDLFATQLHGSDTLYCEASDSESLTTNTLRYEYQNDLDEVKCYGNYTSSFFGCAQFINDKCLASCFLKYCPEEKRHVLKFTLKDWKSAVDNQNKEDALKVLGFF